MADEAFHNAIQHYFDVFLKSDRVVRMVQSGACSQTDFREVFKKNIEKRIRNLPEIDGLSKETVLTSWLAKFDCIMKGTGDEDTKRPSRMQQSLNSELILSKEQLYDMFQQILGIKKFEHQLLFNALLLDSADEQAAAIRRELDGRIQRVNEMEKVPYVAASCFFFFFQLLSFKRHFSNFWSWTHFVLSFFSLSLLQQVLLLLISSTPAVPFFIPRTGSSCPSLSWVVKIWSRSTSKSSGRLSIC